MPVACVIIVLVSQFVHISDFSFRDVAVTILTHPRMEDEWKSAMTFSAINNGRSITALSMLINEMPGT